MKKYPKLLQCDKRGQIVIPKDIRSELKIEEGTGFWAYAIDNEGIFLKKIELEPLDKHSEELSKLEGKSEKIGVKRANVKKAVEKYRKTKDGNLEVI